MKWHILGHLVLIEHRLNTTDYLSIVADRVLPFTSTVYPSPDGYFDMQVQILPKWFLDHDNESMSTWTRTSEERRFNLNLR